MLQTYLRGLLAGPALLAVATAAHAQTNDTIDVDKHQFSLFNPTPRKYMRPMVPDRPGITDSPYTLDAGHFQLEDDGFRLINGRENGGRDRDLYVSHMLLKLGLTDKTDLQVGINSFSINKHWENPATRLPERHAGFGDVLLRVKRNITGDDNRRFALAVLGQLQLPTGGEVGEGATEVAVSLPMVYNLPHDWKIGGQLASIWSYDRDTNSRFLLVVPTFTLDRAFAKWLEGFVEYVGYWDTRRAEWRNSVNLGPQFDFGDNLQLDFGTHIALDRQTDHEYFIGFSFRR